MAYGYYDYLAPYYEDYYASPPFSYYQEEELPKETPAGQLGSTIGQIGGSYLGGQTPGWIGSAISGGSAATAGEGAIATSLGTASPSMMLPSLTTAAPSVAAPAAATSTSSLAPASLSTIAGPLAITAGSAYLLHNYLKGKQRPKIKYNSEDAIAKGDYSSRNPLAPNIKNQVRNYADRTDDEKKGIFDLASKLNIYGAAKGDESPDKSYTTATPGSSYINWHNLMEKPRSMRAGMEDSRSWGDRRDQNTTPTADEINKAYWIKPDKKKELLDLLLRIS